MILIYFPEHPPLPVSRSSFDQSSRLLTFKTLLKDSWACLKNPSFLLLIMLGGMQSGIFNFYEGMLDVVLYPLGLSTIDFSQKMQTFNPKKLFPSNEKAILTRM